MGLRAERGKGTGKIKQLQTLAKQYWLAKRDENTGEIMKQVNWQSGVFSERVWSQKTDMHEEMETLYTWAELIGKCCGEKLAMAAIKRGDVEVRKVKDRFNKTRQMYAMVSMKSNIYLKTMIS